MMRAPLRRVSLPTTHGPPKPLGSFSAESAVGPSPTMVFNLKEPPMGWNDHIDLLLNEEIQNLVTEGVLEKGPPAYGIAQRVLHGDPLSPNQQWVFDTYVAPALERRKEELRLLEIANNAAL